MRRYVVSPYNFGSTDGYGWVDDTLGPNLSDPTAQIAAHHDYCGLYSKDYSVRIWEPGRHAVSSPGVLDVGASGDQQFKAPDLPMKVEIHGIKGAAYIRLDGTAQGVGIWRDEQTGDPFVVQPDWQDTYHALGGRPMFAHMSPDVEDNTHELNPGFKCPFFVAMYRGTYKQIDDISGWEIDSGPADDPDTLLSLNITNPQVLESSRLDWWDLDWVRFPHWDYDGNSTNTWTKAPAGGSWLKYSMDLKTNKHLRPDQVLWLHWKQGVVRLPVALPDQAGGTGAPVLTCAHYTEHKFSISIQATMLATAKIAT